jgi:hypothetical protein
MELHLPWGTLKVRIERIGTRTSKILRSETRTK